jgi:DNA-directed RNA polymerase subunit M/transcription elongation factor TFIIS
MNLNDKYSESIKILSKYIKKENAKIIIKSINDFAIQYSTENEVPSLFEQIFESKFEEIVNALSKSPKLLDDIEIAKNAAFLKPEELFPDNYEKIIKKKELEEYKKNDVQSTSAFTCSKCKQKKCSVIQKQTRAADEPATTFVTCLECGHSFSFN